MKVVDGEQYITDIEVAESLDEIFERLNNIERKLKRLDNRTQQLVTYR
jgi:hypothetical protein